MIDEAILPAIHARLAAALAAPSMRYRPLIVDGIALGWLDDARAARLASFRTVFRVGKDSIALAETLHDCDWRSAALADVTQALREQGEFPAWRDELYAVALTFGAPPALLLERGAARWFGVRTWAAHINGVVQQGNGAQLWFARRSPEKGIDPGRLDNLVGGGIAAGARVDDTLRKEAWEEAGIAADVARHARPAGAVHVRRVLRDGLQRETVFVHDLVLPDDFVPQNQDGEAVEHRLVDLDTAARLIALDRGVDEVTVDASLVVLDFLLRNGSIAPDTNSYLALEALRYLGADVYPHACGFAATLFPLPPKGA
jgi:8-oxo-dGTP pyrophosphatase MutT (NUDIX family)